MIIHPEVIVTPDCPTVRFRESRKGIDLPKVLRNTLKTQGWDVGTYFNVQFISHDRQTLLSHARFVVTEWNESLQTSDANPYQPTTKSVVSHEYAQLGPWWSSEAREAKWNPGKKTYEILQNGVVVDEVRDKEAANALVAA